MTGAVYIPIASSTAIATPSALVSRSTISSPRMSKHEKGERDDRVASCVRRVVDERWPDSGGRDGEQGRAPIGEPSGQQVDGGNDEQARDEGRKADRGERAAETEVTARTSSVWKRWLLGYA